jgi:hypothetical protein
MAHLSSRVHFITARARPCRQRGLKNVKKCQKIRVLFLLMAIGGQAASTQAQPASINGSYDPAFGSALCLQTDATGFGLNLSELDAAYGLIANGNLYLFFSGNLQNNGNNINLFIAGTNGQSTLNAANPGNLELNNLSVMNGSQFSPGFTPIYAFNINNTNTTLTVSQYNLLDNTAVDALGSLTESGNIVANGTVDNSVVVGFNNNNTQSQANDVGPGSLGLELAIPLSLIGNPGGPIEVLADINGSSNDYLSNQFFPGLEGGTANLGTATFNFSSTAGEYFTVPVSSGGGPVQTNQTSQGTRGANVPWISYYAVDMTNSGGTIIGPPAQLANINAAFTDSIPMEASGGQAVELTGTGQYVQLTAQAPANALVLRYCVPDTTNGGGTNYTISLYTNGVFVQELPVTSKYTWLYGTYGTGVPAWTNYPGAGQPRNFFDEVRLNGLTINAGDTVSIERGSNDTAAYYVIDLVDLENVAAPLTTPTNSLSVTSYGADTNGVVDSTAALQNCINAAASEGMSVWLPVGTYLISGTINLPSNTTVQGAGMWYTTLLGNASLYNTSPSYRITLNGDGNNIHLADFAITGFLDYRNDSEPNDGLGGSYGTNSTISRIWVVHTKTGIWLENANGLVIDSCRLRNTIADGINLNTGMRGTIVTNCTTRSTGDDCFAIWPENGAQVYVIGLNVFTHCTAQLPFLANGGAIYGGEGNTIEDCAFTDIPYGCGIYIAGTFAIGSNNEFSGTTIAQRCNLTRCGGRDPNGWSWRAALTIVPGSGSYVQNITNLNINHINITNSLCYAVEVLNNANSGVVSNATMNVVNISNYGVQVDGVYGVWAGLWNGNNIVGSLNVSGLTVNGTAITSMPESGTAVVNQSPPFTFDFLPVPAITASLSGNVLLLSWPADYLGWTLQAQTNAPGIGLGNNWSPISGSSATNQMFFPLNPASGSMFFQLIDL